MTAGQQTYFLRVRRFSTLLRTFPTFLTALFTAVADFPVFLDSCRTRQRSCTTAHGTHLLNLAHGDSFATEFTGVDADAARHRRYMADDRHRVAHQFGLGPVAHA
jgi:hypothetical protein